MEIKAAYFGLKTFAKHLKDCHILIKIDNITSIAVINIMGSIKYNKLNSIVKKMWHWCDKRHIFIFANYINTLKNFVADKNSKIKNIDTEYFLNDNVMTVL